MSNVAADFPTVSRERGKEMVEYILEKKQEGDSVGGIIECKAFGVAPGIGEPMFGGIENKIASAVFGIPAVKGIEFGAGFGVAHMMGSENNDAFIVEEGIVKTKTNNCGGILGGISNGMPICFNVAIKPTPSIKKEQDSIDLETYEAVKLLVPGRHDPCIVQRALPCIIAAAAIAIYDMIQGSKGL